MKWHAALMIPVDSIKANKDTISETWDVDNFLLEQFV